MGQFIGEELKQIEHEVAVIMKDLHLKSLNGKYISWGTFMRAGLKCSQTTSSRNKVNK